MIKLNYKTISVAYNKIIQGIILYTFFKKCYKFSHNVGFTEKENQQRPNFTILRESHNHL